MNVLRNETYANVDINCHIIKLNFLKHAIKMGLGSRGIVNHLGHR